MELSIYFQGKSPLCQDNQQSKYNTTDLTGEYFFSGAYWFNEISAVDYDLYLCKLVRINAHHRTVYRRKLNPYNTIYLMHFANLVTYNKYIQQYKTIAFTFPEININIESLSIKYQKQNRSYFSKYANNLTNN